MTGGWEPGDPDWGQTNEPDTPPSGRRPFNELKEGLRQRLADRDAERQRIWSAIVRWTEIAHRLDDDGQVVPVEGAREIQPLAPFFAEIHAIVFPEDEPGQTGGTGAEHDRVVDRNAVEASFYVCPNHIATHGYEPCCECGGWTDDDPDRGRLCSEALE